MMTSDTKTCESPLCALSPCRTPAACVVATPEEVPLGCDNRRTPFDRERFHFINGRADGAHLTPAAAAVLSTASCGNPSWAVRELLDAGKLILLEPRARHPIRGGGVRGGRAVVETPLAPPVKETVVEEHWIEYVFEDTLGNPIGDLPYVFTSTDGTKQDGRTGPDGKIRRDGIPEGTCVAELTGIQDAAWARGKIKICETAEIRAETAGIATGTAVRIEVFELYKETPEDVVDTLEATVGADGSIAAEWSYERVASTHTPRGKVYAEFIFKVSTDGQWRKSNVLRVELERVINARWSAECARVGDTVELSAEVYGYADGTSVTIEIWERDWVGEDDRIDTQVPAAQVRGAKVSVQWAYEYHEDADDVADEQGRSYNPPEYYFRVKVGEHEASSKILTFRDFLEFTLVDEREQALGGAKVIVMQPDGRRREGVTDAQGCVRFEDVPPGQCRFAIDGHHDVLEISSS